MIEYKRRLKSGNPVTIEEIENELKVLIKEIIETATKEELTSHLRYEKNEKSNIDNYRKKSYEKLERLEKEAYLELLQEMFVKVKEAFSNTIYTGILKECRKKAKLCSPEFFDIYFALSFKENSISKTQMESYIKSLSNEKEFYNVVEKLNKENKIYLFLEILEDYIDDFDKEKSQVICTVLIDLGDSFPEKKGMFEFSKEVRIGRIIYHLLNKIEDKNERFEILKQAIQKETNSKDISI